MESGTGSTKGMGLWRSRDSTYESLHSRSACTIKSHFHLWPPQFTQPTILDWEAQFAWSLLHMKSKKKGNEFESFLISCLLLLKVVLLLCSLCFASSIPPYSVPNRTFFFFCQSMQMLHKGSVHEHAWSKTKCDIIDLLFVVLFFLFAHPPFWQSCYVV